MVKKRSDQPYGLDPKFERAVAGCCATSQSFMTRVGFAVDPALMVDTSAKLVVGAVQEIHKETGRGPNSTSQVLQRLRRGVEAGKVKVSEVAAVSDMLAEFVTGTAEGGTPSVDAVITELAPVLKKHARLGIANLSIRLATEEGMDELRTSIRFLDSIGVAEVAGHAINSAARGWEALKQLKGMTRWPTGIKAVDDYLKGGPPRGTLTTFMAGTGGGKSMVLSHILASCMERDLFAAYATLEIPSVHVLARALACRFGLPIDDILEASPEAAPLGRESGPFAIMDFPAKATTVADIVAWVKGEEEAANRRVDVLIVDYADLLSSSVKSEKAGANTYQTQGTVYTDLRDFIRERNVCGYTASQSRGREEREGKKRLDIQHASDSSNKPRLVDQWITVNVNEETQEIDFFFAKNRYGEGRKSASPSPFNFALGRVGPWADQAVPSRRELGPMRPREPGEDDVVSNEGGQVALDLSAAVSDVEVPF